MRRKALSGHAAPNPVLPLRRFWLLAAEMVNKKIGFILQADGNTPFSFLHAAGRQEKRTGECRLGTCLPGLSPQGQEYGTQSVSRHRQAQRAAGGGFLPCDMHVEACYKFLAGRQAVFQTEPGAQRLVLRF